MITNIKFQPKVPSFFHHLFNNLVLMFIQLDITDFGQIIKRSMGIIQ